MKTVFLLFDSLNRHALSCYDAGAPPHAELRASGRTLGGVRPPLRGQHAVHAGAPRHPDRPPQLPASRLGTPRAVRPFDRRSAARQRHVHAPRHRPLPLLRGRRRGLPRPLLVVGIHPRARRRTSGARRWRPTSTAYAARFHEAQHDFSPDINSKLPYYVNRAHLEATSAFPLDAVLRRGAATFLDAHHARRRLAAASRMLRPARAVLRARALHEGAPADALGGRIFDWPSYGRADVDPAMLAALRDNYFALVAACDHELGRLLDLFDAHDLWRDTCLVVSTDHGLLLGEKAFLGKNRPPFYNEVANIPLLIAAPPSTGHPAAAHRRRSRQTIDLAPTLLALHGQPIPPEMLGRSLLPVLAQRRAAARTPRLHLRTVRRGDQLHRRPLHVFPLSARAVRAGPLPVHADADAHAHVLRRSRSSRTPNVARRPAVHARLPGVEAADPARGARQHGAALSAARCADGAVRPCGRSRAAHAGGRPHEEARIRAAIVALLRDNDAPAGGVRALRARRTRRSRHERASSPSAQCARSAWRGGNSSMSAVRANSLVAQVYERCGGIVAGEHRERRQPQHRGDGQAPRRQRHAGARGVRAPRPPKARCMFRENLGYRVADGADREGLLPTGPWRASSSNAGALRCSCRDRSTRASSTKRTAVNERSRARRSARRPRASAATPSSTGASTRC